jgi:type II secretory pathway component GspD/PulD (secretin)
MLRPAILAWLLWLAPVCGQAFPSFAFVDNLLSRIGHSKWLPVAKALSAEEVLGLRPSSTPASGAPTVSRSEKPDLCYVEMQDADVKSVLKGLAMQHDRNLVFASDLKATRTLSLKGLTFEEALDQLTKYDGMHWHRDGNVYVVGTPERLQELFPELAPEPPPPAPLPRIVSATYVCNHIKADDAVDLLLKLYPADSSPKMVIELAPAPRSPQLSSTYSTTSGMGAQPMEQAEEKSDSRRIFLRGPEDAVYDALAALKEVDQPRKQVNIAVTIRDVTNDALRELGLTWSWTTIGFRESPGRHIQFGEYTREPFNIDAVLSALETDGKAHLLAAPDISVLDGEKAFVLIGQRLLYPVLIGYSQANTPIFDKAEERVGIYLQVSALIGEEGEIALTLYPQVSVVTDYLEINGASYPQISTREAQTTLRVKNGQPIVIAGLIRDEEITTLQKVPGLGDIPLFGELFKRRKKTKLASQVIIVITPTILESFGQ